MNGIVPFILILLLGTAGSNSECSDSSSWESNTLEVQTDGGTRTCFRSKPLKPVLADGQASIGVSAKHPSLLPPWFNASAFTTGQQFANKHFFAQYYGPIHALLVFVGFPDITRMLMSTGKSDTAPKSNRRYLATMLHMKLWFEGGVEGSDDAVDSFLRDSLQNVRAIHHQLLNSVGHKLPQQSAPSPHPVDEAFWEAVHTDLEASAIPTWQRDFPEDVKLGKLVSDGGGGRPKAKPISHLAMGVTQWMLSGPQVMFPEMSGIHGVTDKELESFNHFWATLAYTLGVEDEYNIALHAGDGLAATREYYRQIYETYFVSSMFQIGHDGKVLWEAFFKGFVEAIFGPGSSEYVKKEQFMLLTLEEMMGVEATNLRARLSMSDRALNVFVKRLASWGMRFDTVREQINALFRRYYFEENSKDIFGFDGTNAGDIVDEAYA